MSFINSIKNLKKKIVQKSIISISGNVDDFIVPSLLKTEEIKDVNNKLLTLPEYLCLLMHSMKYEKIYYFNTSSGLMSADENGKIDPTLIGSNLMCSNEFINHINLEINKIKKDKTSWKSKVAFIVDCSDIVLNQNNQQITNDFFASVLNSFVSHFQNSTIDYIKNYCKLIFISKNSNQIYVNLTNNLEYINTNILKPDFNERYEFIKMNNVLFNTKIAIDENSKLELNDASSLTSQLSFREILQLSKISNIFEISNFKSLYNLSMFDKQESEWEKLNKSKLDEIVNVLSKRVKGQNHAISKVKETIIRSFVGLAGISQSKNSKKPKGILFFCGPTGVGKTELAKSIAEFIFGDENKFIRFDMSEYNHESSDQKLLGAPPGYVGYESGGQLTSAVKNAPFSVLLFDEIEKAHSKILDKFLQILEDGRLTSSKGELVDFSETFIIFTSNIGSGEIKNNNFDENQIQKHYIDAVYNYFVNVINRPEILNRIGIKNIVPFNYINNIDVIREIVSHKYNVLKNKIYEEKNIILDSNELEKHLKTLSQMIELKYDKYMGGRAIVVEFETIFIDSLSNFIFDNLDLIYNAKHEKRIIWKIENEKIVFDIHL